MEYNTTELIACVASRVLEDEKSVLVGTGLPIIAATLGLTQDTLFHPPCACRNLRDRRYAVVAPVEPAVCLPVWL